MDFVRVDKWLWRPGSSRRETLAGKACELGRIDWNGQTAKGPRAT